MKIRSVTCFLDPQDPLDEALLACAGVTAARALETFHQAGYEVQTTRLATVPFPELFRDRDPGGIVGSVQKLEKAALAQGFSYTAIGPALMDRPEWYHLIPTIIANTESVFCSAQMATQEGGLSLPAVRACAQIITELAPQDLNGFANLYFTALANVEAGSPFFPAAYHGGGSPGFALATEAAGLAVDAFEDAKTISEGLAILRGKVEDHARTLTKVGDRIAAETGFQFSGIDFSLAPFPEEATSLGNAIERMGVSRTGAHGTLAAAAMLAATLEQAPFRRVGFSGLLFTQLEDSTLADRAAEGVLTVKDLLMYAAVCGTGLDTIPLPGDISADQLAPLLLDLAALALRLDKPLTARLMPVPGKQAGDPTSFDFPYFANSKVMPLSVGELGPPMAQSENIQINSRMKS